LYAPNANPAPSRMIAYRPTPVDAPSAAAVLEDEAEA
jgi:hypothetical protein